MSDMKELFETMKALAEECQGVASINYEFSYDDGALFTISYQKGEVI